MVMADLEDVPPSESDSGQLAAADGLCWLSVLSCLLLACSYVGSLYVWRSELPR